MAFRFSLSLSVVEIPAFRATLVHTHRHLHDVACCDVDASYSSQQQQKMGFFSLHFLYSSYFTRLLLCLFVLFWCVALHKGHLD